MSLLRKLRRNTEKTNRNNHTTRANYANRNKRRQIVLEPLEQRLLLNADLSASEFAVDTPAPHVWGDTLGIVADVINSGDMDAGQFDVTIALSQDNVWDGPGADNVLDVFSVSSLTSDPTGEANLSINDRMVPLPTEGPDGDFNLLLMIDDANTVAENNENNNFTSIPIHIDTPAGSDPDLVISNFNAGGPFIIGQSFEVTNEAYNPSGSPAGGFNVDIVLSTDNTIDTSDRFIGGRSIASLDAGMHNEDHTLVTIPDDGSVTAGTYYLGMIVDPSNTVAEFDEANNTAGFSIQVEEPTANVDLQPISLTWPAETAFSPEASVDITTNVKNFGSDPAGGFTMQIVFSADANFSTYDMLSQWTMTGLDVGIEDTQVHNVIIPAGLADGDYHLGIKADAVNEVDEFNEDNNLFASQIWVGAGGEPGGNIELQPDRFQANNTEPVTWGESINIDADVKNMGDTDAGAFNVSVYLSQDNIPDGSDTVLHNFTINSLAAGGTIITNNFNTTLPGTGTDGDYYLIMEADSGKVIDEPNEEDNVWSMPFYVGSGSGPGQAELQASQLSFDGTGPIVWGGTVGLTAQVSNVGEADAGVFDVDIYLSQDNILDGSDTFLSEFSVTSLAAGSQWTENLSVNMPGSGTDGDYHLIMSVDSGHVIDEPSEDDNIWIAPLNVGSGGGTGGVDLKPDEEGFNPPFDLVWGEQYEFPADVINIGDGGADAFTVGIVLSEDSVYDGSDFALGSVGISGISPYGDSINDVMITLPASGTYADGNYNIIMFVDSAGVVEEINEDNNIAVNPVTIAATANLIEGIDLVAVMFEDGVAGDYQWGQNYVVAADVLNAGDTDAGAFTIKVALSEDMTFDASDEVVGTAEVAALTSGGTSENDMTITLPSADGRTDGQYNLVLSVDSENTVTEVDETNNFDDLDIIIGQGGEPEPETQVELQTQNFGIVGTEPLNWGSSIDVEADVQNVGNQAAGAFEVSIYLSQDNIADGGDTVLHSFTISSLAAAASSTNNLNIALPAAGTDGEYHLIMQVDSGYVIDEPSEDDNVQAMPIYIGEGGGEPGPEGQIELQAENLFVDLTAGANWGAVLNVDAGVKNMGTLDAGAFDVAIYLSQDNIADGSDTLLHSFTINSLTAGTNSTNNFDITLPAAGTDGEYHLIMQVDSGQVIDEPSEEDNVWAMPIYIGEGDGPGPEESVELLAEDLFVDLAAGANWGAVLNVDAGIKNMGTLDAGAFDVTIYLSQDNIADGGDTLLHSFAINSLAASTNSTNNFDITLPAAGTDGEYHLIMQVDSGQVIDEPSEDDNVQAIPIYIGEGGGEPGPEPIDGIDLVADDPGLPEAIDLVWGQSYEACADAFNQGDTDAGAFILNVVLSTDNIYDGTDLSLAEVSVASLAAFSDTINDVNITLPSEGYSDGSYYVMVVADGAGTVGDVDTLNNISMQQVNIAASPNLTAGIDLGVMGFDDDVEGGFDWSMSYEIAADVYNAGDTDAGAFTISIALSSDSLFDAGDTTVGTLEVASLASGAMSINDVMITLPAEGIIPDGGYFLVMVVDSGNAVAEADESNNTVAFDIFVGEGGEPGPGPEPEDGVDIRPDGEDIAPPIDLVWGGQYELPIDAFNAADGSAGAFTISVVLSQDGIYDSGDYELATVNVEGIGPWGESINDVMVTLPEAETYPDGTYNIIMFVDSNNTVEEFDENNNIGVCPINIVTTANIVEGVDLIPTEFGVDMEGMTGPFQWSGSYTGFADVYNIGNTDAGAFTIKIALSMDMNFDSADTVLGTVQVESLPAGQFSENDIMITLPTEGFMDGEYFLVLSIDSDNTVTEIDEANNFDDTNIFIGEGGMEPGPDMDGIDLAIPFVDVPWQVVEGQEIQVGFEVENWGNVDAEAFTVSFFLSQDPTIEVDASGVIGENEIALGEVTLAGLIAGSFAEDVTTLTLPSELGYDSCYLVAIANFDRSVEENFHDNNHNMAFMNVMGSGTDLALMDIFMPYDAQWGQVINVDARVENRSAQTVDSVDVAFYLSEDWEFDGSDTLLTTVNLIDIFGGTEAIATAEITLPNDQGGESFMKVIAKVDPDEIIEETDEFNNIWVRDLYIGTPELANLMAWPMIMFDPVQGGVDWGQSLTVDTVIHNGSNVTTQGAFTITYYLSLDDTPDGGDTVLHNEEVTNSIMPFEHYFRTVTMNTPSENPTGVEQNEWFILAEADSGNTIVEFDEMDNVGWSNIFIGSRPADLTGWFDIDVEGNVIWGEQISITGNIENMGGSDVGEFEVSYYLTSDPEIDENDYLLATQTIGSLAAQAATPVLNSLVLPDNSSGQFDSGTFFIVGVIDSADSVAEFDEYNNFMGDWLTTDVAAAELVAFHLEPYVDAGEPVPEPDIEPDPMPSQGGPLLWNQPINVNYALGNMGNLDAENFQVSFYLAGYDAIVEQAHLLGSETISLLQADEELHSGTTLTLPDPDTLNFVEAGKVDGTYMLMMQVDAAGTVDEMMEENNIFFMPIRLEMPRGMMEVTDSLNDPYDLMIDIGPVLEGDSVNESFTVTNAGAGVININGIATDNDMFTITQNGTIVDGASVFAVDPQANLTFEVVFNAVVQGYHQGQIQIISDDPDGSDVFLSVWADVVSAPVDLSLDSITTAFSAHWGDTTDVTLGIRNLQDNEAEDVFVEVMLSDSQDPFSMGAMSFPLGNESIGAITGNANIQQTLSIVLPEVSPFGFGGQFYLHAVISPAGSSFDENIENNENIASIEITTEAVGKPDLAFAWLWLPPEAQWGDTVNISAGISNMGMADAGSFDVHYYLSDNDVLDTSDQLISEGADTELPGLSAMGEIEGQLTLTLPEDGTVDMYYLIVVIDPANAVLEDFEDNNMAIGRFLMNSGQTIDLEPVSVSAPQEVTIGNMFDITLDVSSTGPEDAMDVRVEFFLSEQGQTDEFFLGQFIGSTTIDVNAGQTTTAIYQTMLPDGLVEPGQDYFVRAFVDANHIYFESDEENNIILSNEPIHAVGGDIDLTAAFDYVPAQGSWDESFAIDVTISNTGDITAAPFFVDAFLSNDDTLDTSDFYLASKMVYALDGSTEQSLNMDIFLPHSRPSGDGDYYLLVNVDGGQCVVENDENNNVIGSAITISGTPDLAIFWEETPYNTNFGQTITVTDEVENWGNSPAGEFEISYYLSDDMIFGEDDVLLGSRMVGSLAAESENTADTDLNLPEEGDEGQYYLIAVADATNEIDESFEGELTAGEIQWNNITAAPLEIISEGMPDLKTTVLSLLAETSDWGDEIAVQKTIANIGAVDAGEFVVTYYLSDNPSITSLDHVLGTETITSLTAGSTHNQPVYLTLPDQQDESISGEYYIGAKVDSGGVVAEINEDNNIYVSDGVITIGDVVTVDLVAAFVTCPNIVEAGEPVEIYYEVYNAGTSNSEAFDIDFYLTDSGQLDGTETLLGSTTIDSLNAGAFDGEAAQWTLSEELGGSYFVAMQVNADGTVEEKTGSNNTAVSWNAITISEPVQVDVAAVNVNSDLAEAAWGDSLSIRYELQSSGDLSGAVTVGFYISQADGLTGEVQIGQTQVNITADGLFEGDLDLLLPAESPFGRDGDYILIASADPDNNIPESNEYNNSAFTNINIGSGLADLAALNISGVPTASAGESFEVFNELANFGSVEAEDFDVYFYLTADNTAIDTGSDTYLGMRHLGSLSADAVNWTLTTLAIPAGGVEDGTYYLAMQVDTFDDVDEALETNNIIFSEKPLQLRSITVTPDDYEPNNTTGTATNLTIDEDGLIETVTATLHNNTDADYFSFTVPTSANGFAKLNIVPSDTLNAAAFVYNSDGTQVGGADMDPEFGGEEIFTTFSLTPGREYLVLVRPIGDSFGEYTMDIELGLGTTGDAYETNETTATAYYLGNSSVSLFDANIHNGSDIDYYQFAAGATSTGQMVISVGPDPTLDAILQVFDSAGEFIGSSDVGGAGSVESITMTGAVGDNYYARVTSWAESTGSYQFNLAFTAARLPDSYEPNDDVASAYGLTSDFLTSPTIHSGDVDYYQLTVPESETQLTAYIFNSEGLDGSLAIYDQEGTLLHNVNRSGVNGSEVLMIDGLAGQQQLYLAVTGEEDTTGRYSLELDYGDEETGDIAEPNNQLTTAYPMTLTDGRGELDELSLHNEADRDYFSFIAPQDTDGTAYVTVWPADEADELNVSLGLFDNSGTTLKSTDATGAGETETLTLTSGLTAGETYYIDVNGWGSTGDYKLTVRTPLLSAATADDVPSVEPLYDVGILPSTGYLLDGSEPEIYVVEEVAGANDNDLSFGATPVGNSLTCTFSVLNTGGSSLNISDVTLAGADSGVFSVALADGEAGDPTAADIEPGQSQQYTVTFTPTGMQLYSQATLTVASNDSDESSYNLALSGTGTVSTAKPDIAITDLDEESLTTLTFDDTMLDVTGTASFLIANEGTATLTVTSATLSGTDADAFSVYYTNIADKTTDDYLVIADGQKLMKIEFSPTSVGTHTATLTLTSNDPDESTVSVQLVGSSVEPDLIVDITPDDGTVANPLDATLAFGQVVNDGSGGQKGQYPINLVNTGTSSLTVNSIAFSDTAFGIAVTGMDSYPFEIAAGQSISAMVEFDPILVGSLTGETMTINSDDPDSPAMQFTLTGQGVQANVNELEFGDTLTYTESDGDVVKVQFGYSGTAALTFDGSLESFAQISGIVITDASMAGSLTITVTDPAGNGLADIGTITTDSAFGTFRIAGDVDNISVGGQVITVNLDGSLGGFDADGSVVIFTTGGLSGDISADSFLLTTVNGDVSDAEISTQPSSATGMLLITIEGDVTNTTIDTSSIMMMTVNGDIDDMTINAAGTGGQLGMTTINGSVQGLNVTAGSMSNLKVVGDLLDSSFTAEGDLARCGTVNVSGDADFDLSVAGNIAGITVEGDLAGEINATGSTGRISSVSVGGELSASLGAYNSIMTINAGGDITSDAITIEGSGNGLLCRLNAGGNVNVADLSVDGSLLFLTAGSSQSPGNLSGNISADNMIMMMNVYGNVSGDVTAGSQLFFATINGDLSADADITSTDGDIIKLLVGNKIYGNVHARNGEGRVIMIQRGQNAFVNADTGIADTAAVHINADLSYTLWLNG